MVEEIEVWQSNVNYNNLPDFYLQKGKQVFNVFRGICSGTWIISRRPCSRMNDKDINMSRSSDLSFLVVIGHSVEEIWKLAIKTEEALEIMLPIIVY